MTSLFSDPRLHSFSPTLSEMLLTECCRVTYLKVQSRIPATLRDGGGVGSHHALTGTLSRTMM